MLAMYQTLFIYSCVNFFIDILLQMRKLWHRMVKLLAQDTQLENYESLSQPGHADPRAHIVSN